MGTYAALHKNHYQGFKIFDCMWSWFARLQVNALMQNDCSYAYRRVTTHFFFLEGKGMRHLFSRATGHGDVGTSTSRLQG